MSLSITDLITPAPSGVLIGNPGAVPPNGSWEATLLQIATTLDLPITAWQPGQPNRTMLALASIALAEQDVLVSMAAQGGFLDFAATGTVPVVDLQGNTTQVAVSPDPSTVSPTPTTANTWLDALADSVYNVQRTPATYAGGPLTITNASAVSYAFQTGQYHVANPTTGVTYHNRDAITIASSGVTTGVFVADALGPGSTAVASSVTSPVTVLVGVTINNATTWTGSNWETNLSLANRCRLKLASLSPDGAAAAYAYVALTAYQLLQASTPPVIIVPITQALVQSDRLTGHVVLTLANAGGPVTGAVQLKVIGVVSNSGLVEIHTAYAHGLSTGEYATVSGVIGVAAANATSTITVTASDRFTLDGSVFAGSYVSGGAVEGGDLGEVDSLINALVVPNAVTEITQSAVAQVVNVTGDIFVPVAGVNAAIAAVQAALSSYFTTIPIGGFTDPGGAFTQVLPFDAVLGIMFSAIAPFGGQQVTALLNGGNANVDLSPAKVATLGTVTITGHGV